MSMRVFITGGAGFIGSALTRILGANGAEVAIFDNFLEQVHGPAPGIALPAEIVRGDVRDAELLSATLARFKPDVIVHLAAETGTGQSADEPARYTSVNVVGTANLLEAARRVPPKRIVLAGTRAVYGEGAYLDRTGRRTVPEPRRNEDMVAGRFGVYDDGVELSPAPTPEDSRPRPSSVYGSSKLMQEYLLQQTQPAFPHVILRLQNVYGPGQSLKNPYTGVLSIFCQQAQNGQRLNIYEDGEITRDFVFVDDVARAFALACTEERALGRTINIGTGRPLSIRHAAETILDKLGLARDRYDVSGMFRAGDVRYAVAEVTKARELLGWSPNVAFEAGIAVLVKWAQTGG
ncbi:MAG: NAD-dependent epimerase/dehydratase family protein [Alphaproteobacteria bacterium]|nr:NAD-dependent epimerase/dehydratase family protein [Alphaproteobacteria bacterium]